jgi:hypothetical protein
MGKLDGKVAIPSAPPHVLRLPAPPRPAAYGAAVKPAT